MNDSNQQPARDSKAIAALNDEFRRTGQGGRTVITAGVHRLDPEDLRAVLRCVHDFDDFNPRNDPYGEHDFGGFMYEGRKFFWKIEYYDKALQLGSENPADPEITTRVLTVMFASEY